MSNPYDQFDDESNLRKVSTTPSSNPYDQFDAGSAPAQSASWWDTIRAVPGVTLGQAEKALGGTMQAAGERPPTPFTPSPFLSKLAEAALMRIKPTERDKQLAKVGETVADIGEQRVKEATPENLDYWKSAVLGGVSNTVAQIPPLALSIATRNPAPSLAAAGLQTAGSSYAEARAAGAEPEQASTHAAIDTSAEMLFGYIPTKFLTDKAAGPVLKTILGTYAREIPSELMTTAVQSANAQLRDKELKGKELSWEEYGRDLLDTLGQTIVSAPLMGATAKGLSKLTEQKPKLQPMEQTGPQVPTGWLPPGAHGPAMWDGSINVQLTEPSFDEPTLQIDSVPKEILKQELLAIDPETIDAKQLEEDRKLLEEHRKAKDAPPRPDAEVSWTALSAAPKGSIDVGELSASAKQTANAANYPNPNVGERLDRIFSFSTNPAAVGKTPRQVAPEPGVYVLGAPTVDRPEAMLQPMMETAEEWRKRWMPNSTIVLSNEQLLTDSALGWHYSMGDGKHLIVPAVLRKLTDPSKFNVNTLAGAFYNLSHEFGHALVKDRFYEGASPDTMVRVASESKFGVVSPEALAGLPELQRKVVEEYNAIRARILDGSMNAEELVKTWFGPAKLGRDFLGDLKVAPTAPAIEVGRAIANRAADNSTIKDEIGTKQFRDKMLEDVFSLDEYLAEQTSRYAYARKLDQTSALGKFLQKGLDSLRKFFAQIKGDGIVAPGTSFAEWLDGLPQISRLAQEKQHVVESKKKAGKKVVKAAAKSPPKPAAKATAPAKAKAAVKRVEHQVRADTKLSYEQKAKGIVARLVADGTIEKGSGVHEEALELIQNNERDHFLDLLREVTGKTVKFEIDGQDDKKLTKLEEWRPDRFRSRYFKAWFGDWERPEGPDAASVVRVGAFEEMQGGQISIRAEEPAPPLITFISRHRLAENQVYYTSTLRGAHFAESVLGETHGRTPSNDMVPVVLNIRNPYIVPDASTEAPSPAEMQSKGHDGIVYRNTFDGDFSFVVFSLDQIRIVDDRSAYQGLFGVSMELDIDQATPTGRGAARLLQGVSNFLNERGPLRRALRRIVHQQEHVFQLQQLSHMYPALGSDPTAAQHAPFSRDLAFFNQTNTNFVRYGASRRAVPDRILSVWQRMGKRNSQKVNTILQKEADEGVHWFELTKTKKNREGAEIDWFEFSLGETAKAKLKENGVDIETELGERLAKHILDVKNSLLDSLNEDEHILFELLALRHAANPPVMKAMWREVRAKVHEMRKVPFFPQGRFGNFMVTIEKKKATGSGYEVVWQEAFESEAKWEEAYEKAVSTKESDERVRKHELTDTEYVLMSLPKDFLETIASELGLSPKQVEVLNEIARPVKTERLLKPYDLAKRKIKGYSSDAMRSYANFTWHHSNAQAKVLHAAKFNIAIGNVKQLKAELERSEQADFAQLALTTKVLNAMEGTKEYIMSPPNEAQTARAAVSLVYLGLNVKTAVLNLYGLITVWSDMIDKFGALQGPKRMAEAAKLAALSMKLTDLNKRREGDYMPPDIQRGLDRAIEEGVLSQSYAYHLAGAANSNNLSRLPGYEHLGRIGQHTVDVGMYPFRLMELATRRIAFVAAMQEQLEKNPGEFDQAYSNAVSQVNILQNDYSSGNRVPFMRGGKGLRAIVPLATIFMSFAQHMAFHGYGGYELGLRRKRELEVLEGRLPASAKPKWFEWGYGYTARIWVLTLLVAGYEGLPGMENILDLIEVLWRKIGKKPMRQELREMIQAVDGDPVFWSRGLSHDLLGFDLSRSVGFGRIIPGTDVIGRSKEQSAEELAGSLAFNLMGPTGGLLKFGFDAFGNDKSWGEKLQKLPGGIGNIWNAIYWSEHGVLNPNGARITLEQQPDGQMKARDLTGLEIAGKALGFNPTIVSQNREILWNQYDMKMYFNGKRMGLKDQWWDAVREGDKEAMADVKKAISEFNADLGSDPQFKSMRILPKELADSVRTRRRNLQLQERGLPTDKRSRGIYEDVRESYDRDRP